LQDIEIVRAKIVPKTCQDCAKLPLSGITKSSTINGEVYDSITSKNCNVCPREQSEHQRPNFVRFFRHMSCTPPVHDTWQSQYRLPVVS
jgi:biotin synthase-related radical SAM superfamily protein